MHPRAWWVPALLLVAAGLLVAGQVLPGVTIRTPARPEESYSVFGGVVDLWRGRHPELAVVLFSFSIVFPVVKLCALAWLWFRPMHVGPRASAAQRLKPLGKWSLLDAFVVAALVGAVQLRTKLVVLATAEVENAVYWFAASIVLTILLSFHIARLADDAAEGTHFVPRLDRTTLLVPFVAAGCLVAALVQPLLFVERSLFETTPVKHVYGFASAWTDLVADGEWVLAVLLALFVVLLPLVYFLGLGSLAWLQLRGRVSDRALSTLAALERWAMVDVYFLGVLLVRTKVGGFADATRLPGFWFLAAAASLSIYCAIRVRRVS